MNSSFVSSFRSKEGSNSLRSTYSYQNENEPPKTFQEIAFRNQERAILESNAQRQQKHYESSVYCKQTAKKTVQKEPLIKKSNSQIFKLPFMNGQDRKQPRIERKENIDFRSVVMKNRDINVANEYRPEIVAPSFMKNTRSFIHNFSHNTPHDNSFCQKTKKLYEASECNSITLSDRQSVQEFQSSSINNSLRDLSEKDKRSMSGSNQGSSIELTKQLNDINSKIKGILNSSLKFGRKASEEDNKSNTGRETETDSFMVHNSTNLISPPLIKTSTVCEREQSLTESRTISSINFSKKFQHYKKQTSSSIIQRKVELNDFQLLEELGSGKYGKVYMARHKHSGFVSAIKCVSKAMIEEQNIEIPFIREIKIQMYLNHPNIVKLYGFFNDNQNVYLIMQYCSGGHLLKKMKEKSSFEETQILQILSNIFEAVEFLHCHGIIHRDLKPQNVVIQNGIYKLCDFGWAAYVRGDSRTTFCGTPLYVSPQILKGEQYDAKTDVWGLGIITYELAYGRVPFPIWNQSDMRKIVNDPVYFPAWADVSQKMISLIKTMLFKNPDDRCSLNEILNKGILQQYLGFQKSIKSEIESLF